MNERQQYEKHLADKLQAANGELKNTLQNEQVFEHGFSHLKSGFDAGLEQSQIFDQWISVVPTEQIVAREYVETDFGDGSPPAAPAG